MTRARLALAVSLCLFGVAAFAQNNRSAVSVSGSDMNTCTTIAPCRSFSVAIAHTNPGGEVIAFDSGGYGPFIVTQPVVVSGAPGVHAAITTSGIGIDVNLGFATDAVFLRNLVVIGAFGASHGIRVGTLGKVHIVNCLVRGIVGGGGITVTGAETEIDNVIVQGNAWGIAFTGSSVFHARVSNSQIDDNPIAAGIDAAPFVRLVVTNTSMTGNAYGVRAESTVNGNAVDVTLDHCVIHGNGVGIAASAPDTDSDAVIRLYGCVISYNTGAAVQKLASFIYTYGNNAISANNPDPPMGVLTPLPQQ